MPVPLADAITGALNISTHSILSIAIGGRDCHTHFTDERGGIISQEQPRMHCRLTESMTGDRIHTKRVILLEKERVLRVEESRLDQ